MTTTAPPTINYYELLGLPPTASPEQIEKKIKEEQRTWRKRVGSADLSKRQEAETRMERLAEAKKILLDSASRSRFDAALPSMRTGASAPAPSSADGQGDWVALAKEYLAVNDYHSAAYAAREATHVLGNSAEAWNLRSRASGGLGRFEDALYEARQAVGLDDRNSQYHADLGLAQESLNRWSDALQSYETAASIDPGNFVYRLSVAGVYLQNDMLGKALPILEEVHRKHGGEEMVDYYLAACLHDLAEEVPRVQRGDGYAVTSLDEIERMEAYVQRAKGLKHGDAELAASLDKIQTYLDKSRQAKFRMPSAVADLADAGFGLFVFGATLFFLGPLILIFGGLAAVSGGVMDGGAFFVCLLLGGLWGWGVIKACWVPVWKANARTYGKR